MIPVDDTHHLKAALSVLGLRLQMRRNGNLTSIEHIFREVKQCTYSSSNMSSHMQPTTAARWLQVFAVRWNHA